MTPSARVQAAIEILDEVIASARDDGPPADAIVSRYFKTRRYAGSKDRRAVRELVFRAIRRSGERPESGRVGDARPGRRRCRAARPVRRLAARRRPIATSARSGSASRAAARNGSSPSCRPLVTPDEWPALLERAPLDLRVNVARDQSRRRCSSQFEGAEPTPLSPWGLRLPPDTRVDDHPAFCEGLVEVQDEGSQLIALACEPQPMAADPRPVRRGRRQVAGAGRGGARRRRSSPADTNRARLSQLPPRAERAGATIETRLLDGGREAAQLADLAGTVRHRAGRCALQRQRAPGAATPKAAGG